MTGVRVTIRYVEGCPHWRTADGRVRDALTRSGHVGTVVEHERVATHEVAVTLGFVGSPTILIDGVDLFAVEGAPAGLACRLYPTPSGTDGCPSVEQLVERLAVLAADGR